MKSQTIALIVSDAAPAKPSMLPNREVDFLPQARFKESVKG